MIDYNKLLSFAKEVFPQLNDMIIILKHDECFSCLPVNDNHFVIA